MLDTICFAIDESCMSSLLEESEFISSLFYVSKNMFLELTLKYSFLLCKDVCELSYLKYLFSALNNDPNLISLQISTKG